MSIYVYKEGAPSINKWAQTILDADHNGKADTIKVGLNQDDMANPTRKQTTFVGRDGKNYTLVEEADPESLKVGTVNRQIGDIGTHYKIYAGTSTDGEPLREFIVGEDYVVRDASNNEIITKVQTVLKPSFGPGLGHTLDEVEIYGVPGANSLIADPFAPGAQIGIKDYTGHLTRYEVDAQGNIRLQGENGQQGQPLSAEDEAKVRTQLRTATQSWPVFSSTQKNDVTAPGVDRISLRHFEYGYNSDFSAYSVLSGEQTTIHLDQDWAITTLDTDESSSEGQRSNHFGMVDVTYQGNVKQRLFLDATEVPTDAPMENADFPAYNDATYVPEEQYVATGVNGSSVPAQDDTTYVPEGRTVNPVPIDVDSEGSTRIPEGRAGIDTEKPPRQTGPASVTVSAPGYRPDKSLWSDGEAGSGWGHWRAI